MNAVVSNLTKSTKIESQNSFFAIWEKMVDKLPLILMNIHDALFYQMSDWLGEGSQSSGRAVFLLNPRVLY